MDKAKAAIPTRMSAVLLTGHGGLDKLAYRRDAPVPVPALGEVLIRVAACGMNNTDVWVRQGAYGTEQNPDAVSSWRRQGGRSGRPADGQSMSSPTWWEGPCSTICCGCCVPKAAS